MTTSTRVRLARFRRLGEAAVSRPQEEVEQEGAEIAAIMCGATTSDGRAQRSFGFIHDPVEPTEEIDFNVDPT